MVLKKQIPHEHLQGVPQGMGLCSLVWHACIRRAKCFFGGLKVPLWVLEWPISKSCSYYCFGSSLSWGQTNPKYLEMQKVRYNNTHCIDQLCMLVKACMRETWFLALRSTHSSLPTNWCFHAALPCFFDTLLQTIGGHACS